MKMNQLNMKMIFLVSFLFGLMSLHDIFGNNFYINVLDFGAKPDSLTDNTLAFQKALDKASLNGSTVYVPAGYYVINGNLVLKNASLIGENQTHQSIAAIKGTVILAQGNKNNENGKPLFNLMYESAIKRITVFYPEQLPYDVKPYPFTFHISSGMDSIFANDCRIEDITLINSYNGIKIGPNLNVRHYISNVFGCVLRRGILLETTGDIGRIENVHFHCDFWRPELLKGHSKKAKPYKVMRDSLEAFIIGRTDWEYMSNTFVYPAKIGYHFIRSEHRKKWKGGANGQFSGIGADATSIAIQIDDIQPMGLLITNGEFNSHKVGEALEVLVTEKCRGSIRFENCGFWGPVNHNAVIKGDCYVSFNNCYFSNNYVTDKYSIVAENGKLQVSNCTFDASESHEIEGKGGAPGEIAWQPCIHLKPGLKHAIITGNNGYKGVIIKNEIGEKAIIQNNEPEKGAIPIEPAYYKNYPY